MKFLLWRSWFTIPEPPTRWTLQEQVPYCTACKKALHLVFNSPPRSGIANCGCGPAGEHGFHQETNAQEEKAA